MEQGPSRNHEKLFKNKKNPLCSLIIKARTEFESWPKGSKEIAFEFPYCCLLNPEKAGHFQTHSFPFARETVWVG